MKEFSGIPTQNGMPSISNIFKDQHEQMIMTPAYEQAIAVLEQKINIEDFADTYSEELMGKCRDYVDKRESQFAHKRATNESWARAEVFGKTLEAILHDQINQGIFGEDVRGVSTSTFDDYYAGIDEVIERYGPDGSTYIGCALDFTFGNPNNKIDSVCADIQAGKLRDVTFYESPFGNPPLIHGKLQGIPKVIVGVDAPHLLQLAQQWTEGDSQVLEHNQLFLSILRQIQMQSEVYSIIANRYHQKEVAERYEKVHSAITKLYTELKEQRAVVALDPQITGDGVHRAITERMHQLISAK
ncbi:MAG: hypothetical protein KC877_04155 [Candidatus Kaiserbacteria bacterium]|nr:hypothetical protein [Candidatus Kaiserbacteria bacterium]MCB9816752.1 hypothetical protein [Candidatus Nomurabacteria bacterium]